MDSLNWVYELPDTIWNWLLSVRDKQHPGWFRFCRTGALFQPSSDRGLGTSSMALKVCFQINSLSRVNDTDLHHWIEYIQSFQRELENNSGTFFEDGWLLRAAGWKARLDRWIRKDLSIQRAETRQACAALLSAGAAPKFAISGIPDSMPQVDKYISGLPWGRDPWGASSHVSHLVFFLKLNADYFGRKAACDELLPFIFQRLDGLQDRETGSWFAGSPPEPQKINSAMKILLAYDLLGRAPEYPERLIDLCLKAVTDEDACHSVDIIYVLYFCSRLTSHRSDDIKAFAEDKLRLIKKHLRSDGAFSFYPDRAGDNYYGARISRGNPESDIHGTHLLVWALTMIGEMLGFNRELGWKLPVT
jgi:hypothetical protein